ncbi:MAG: DUF5011 domain-containing protein [Candidatus Paceibacterota bacterium]
MQRLAHYILYNNTFTLLFVFLLLSGGTVMASNEDVRDAMAGAVITSEETVRQVSNRAILEADIHNHDFRVQVEYVEEDDISYFVHYSYQTYAVIDGVWQEAVREEILVVSKSQLGTKDLDTFITTQLAEVVNAERQMLIETQEIERRIGANNKIVERTYSGLVGRFLDPDEVVYEEESKNTPVATGTSTSSGSGSGGVTGTSTATSTSDGGSTASSTATTTASTTPSGGGGGSTPQADTTPPVITLAGDATITLTEGDTYDEPGAAATDTKDGDLTAQITINGTVDTDTAGTYTLTYSVADAAGNEATKTRTVVVEAAAEPEPPPEEPEEETSPPPPEEPEDEEPAPPPATE